jgi:glycosyltransferase involved in cell wall biosynthesis
VFNVSDLWPESAIRMGIVKPGILTWMAERLELKLYRNAAAVTGQSGEIIDSVHQRCPGTKTAVVTNGVDPNRFGKSFADQAARELLGSEPGPIFIFAGLLGHAQGLHQVLDVAQWLPKQQPGRFVLVGEGPEREVLEERIAREKIPRVKLVPAQPRERVPALLAAADVALITLGMPIPGAVPSKIYEAMASSLPILLVATGEPARRVTEAGCGLAVPPGNLAGIGEAFQKLANDGALRERMGAAGRQAAETTYNRDAIGRKLDAFLRGLIDAGNQSETLTPLAAHS